VMTARDRSRVSTGQPEGDDRDEGISEGVAEQDTALAGAFAAGARCARSLVHGDIHHRRTRWYRLNAAIVTAASVKDGKHHRSPVQGHLAKRVARRRDVRTEDVVRQLRR